ncbi:sulfurtransferase [Microbacterium ulmi]|uniref:Sulfurtransferase n=1 Tax=Microbacterium ulmi TaxID=179095 RepID=A0A7Y2Q2Q3_9MICO|nr:sulfurtransferase [Microbacterium ulmi]NII68268.1 thiosulfate/3-mercaptopyruvate sulfurtransferase [Microbacterium ulmi]NNH04888.1 sulfurtransferase [Microbacterium ulmi]
MPLLITPTDLSDLLATDARVRLLDVRWRLDRPDGHPQYLEGHLPGAVYVDLDHELARHGEPHEGRHPLPTRDALQDAARRWGLDEGDVVVIYDDFQSFAAARAWWLLSTSGVADVRVLDGGLRGWVAAGLPVETGDVRPPRGSVVLTGLEGPVASIDDAAAWPARGVLLDVRAPERYRGETEPLDPRAGHIPGAVNLPTTSHVAAGRFLHPDALAASFAAAGAVPGVPVAAYCGSGITAAHTALAGALAGVEVTVFPGSWSAWSNSPGRDVATGPLPDGDAAPR